MSARCRHHNACNTHLIRVEEERRGERRFSAFTLTELLVVIAIIGVLVALLLPAIQRARESARIVHCRNNMRQIGLSVQMYTSTSYDAFPTWLTPYSGEMRDASLQRSNHISHFGWKVQCLPYLEQQAVFDSLELSLPQDESFSTANRRVASTVLPVFVCPTVPDGSLAIDCQFGDTKLSTPLGGCDYGAPILGTLEGYRRFAVPFSPSGLQGLIQEQPSDFNFAYVTSGSSINDVTDGLSQTLLIGECGREPQFDRAEIRYQKPADFVFSPYWQGAAWALRDSFYNVPEFYDIANPLDSQTSTGFRTFHARGSNICVCDGSVRWINKDIANRVFLSLMTRDQGDVVEE